MRESLTEEAVKKRLCTSPLRLVANAPAASRSPRRQTGTLQRCELARASNAPARSSFSNARLSCRPFRCYVDAVSATNDVEDETGLTVGDADVVVQRLKAVALGTAKYAGQDGSGRHDGLALRDVRCVQTLNKIALTSAEHEAAADARRKRRREEKIEAQITKGMRKSQRTRDRGDRVDKRIRGRELYVYNPDRRRKRFRYLDRMPERAAQDHVDPSVEQLLAKCEVLCHLDASDLRHEPDAYPTVSSGCAFVEAEAQLLRDEVRWAAWAESQLPLTCLPSERVRDWDADAPSMTHGARRPRPQLSHVTNREVDKYYDIARRSNAVTFGAEEARHPINFYEQRLRCYSCGTDRFVVTKSSLCCAHGAIQIGDVLPNEHLDLMCEGDGISKESRVLNNMFRLAQMALPKGTHHIPDSYQHLKINGVTYAIIPNLNERTSTRSFLDDPATRMDERMLKHGQGAIEPSEQVVRRLDSILSENYLVQTLVRWYNEPMPSARLLLRWPGTSPSVSAFSLIPSTSVIEPRSVFFTRNDEDEKCVIDTSDPLYAPLMWPLAFPSGLPPRDVDGFLLSDAASVRQRGGDGSLTMALMLQPEVRPDGTYLLVPTRAFWNPEVMVPRRFGRMELLGRLGDEFVIDRHLGEFDKRLRMLASTQFQSRLRGGVDAETITDADVLENGTYVPASEHGSPRQLRDKCANALACFRILGKTVLFITGTTDVKSWPEVWTRLAQFDDSTQDVFDRASLHSEVFEHKLMALLARLRSGTILRNIGRPRWCSESQAWVYELSTADGGYMIGAIEYQARGLVHVHLAWRPGHVRPDMNQSVVPGREVPWVDEFVCARVPSMDILREFKMVGKFSEMLRLDGVRVAKEREQSGFSRDRGDGSDRDDNVDDVENDVETNERMAYEQHDDENDEQDDDERVVYEQYEAWYNAALDRQRRQLAEGVQNPDPEVVQPDIGCDFGEVYLGSVCPHTKRRLDDGPSQLLARMVKLIAEEPASVDRTDHWSLHAHGRTGAGRMVHKHPKGMHVPVQGHCARNGKCKDRYPKVARKSSVIGADRRVEYRRDLCDVMIVPYNPWITLYFTSHINVEIVCSAVHVIAYLCVADTLHRTLCCARLALAHARCWDPHLVSR